MEPKIHARLIIERAKAGRLALAITVIALGFTVSSVAAAQDSRPATPPSGDAAAMPGMTVDKMDPNMPGMDMGGNGDTMMPAALGDYPMMREASGTSWQPQSTPMDGISGKQGGWAGMIHGDIVAAYDHQGGPRGAQKTFSESMLMVMGERALGPGKLTLRTMLSLDPAMGPSGYPLLLQTGETANGTTPLIDRQHPHDLFMELAAVYSAPLTEKVSAFLYAGYPGEPALGPPAFMHRFSGMDNPEAPISHHWLDATHITYGVLTAGLVYDRWKLEGSVFKGREPDQHRWNFDSARLDSYSARVSFNPTDHWALQASYGYIKSPEQLEPDVDQRRTTVSAMYNRAISDGNWQTTLAWGRNAVTGGPTLDAVLLESAVTLKRHTVFARAETAQKNELFLAPSPLAGRVFQVSTASLGYVYDIPVGRHFAVGLGVVGSAYALPDAVKPAYGGDPTSCMTFIRFKTR